MKYKSYLIAILWGIQFCFTLPVSAQNTIQQQKDSLRRAIEQSDGTDKLRSYNRLYYLYMSEIADDRKMDTLLTLFGADGSRGHQTGKRKNARDGVWKHHHLSYK